MTRSPPSRHRSHVSRLRRIRPTRLLPRQRSLNPKHGIRMVMVTVTFARPRVPTRVPVRYTTRVGLLLLQRRTPHPRSLRCAPELPSSQYGTLSMPRSAVVQLQRPPRRKRRRPAVTTAPRSRRRPPATYRPRPRSATMAGGHREVERKVKITLVEVLVVGGYTIGSDCCHLPIYLLSLRLVSGSASDSSHLRPSTYLVHSRVLRCSSHMHYVTRTHLSSTYPRAFAHKYQSLSHSRLAHHSWLHPHHALAVTHSLPY